MDEVPETLTMDVTLLHLNKKICECAIHSDNISSLETFILHGLNQTEILQDPWVRFQLEYNLKSIELYNNGESAIYPSELFIPNCNKDVTAITVFDNLPLKSDKIPICLSLSPNWRY